MKRMTAAALIAVMLALSCLAGAAASQTGGGKDPPNRFAAVCGRTYARSRPEGSRIKSIPDSRLKESPCSSARRVSRTAAFTAASVSRHSLTMFGLAFRHAVTSSCSSSSGTPISRAPMARRAPVPPP